MPGYTTSGFVNRGDGPSIPRMTTGPSEPLPPEYIQIVQIVQELMAENVNLRSQLAGNDKAENQRYRQYAEFLGQAISEFQVYQKQAQELPVTADYRDGEIGRPR